jgi:hypothetical protein
MALAFCAPSDVAFGLLSGLGNRNFQYFVAQYTPCTLAVYASACGRKTRYGASGSDLPRRDFHPRDTVSFSWRTQ